MDARAIRTADDWFIAMRSYPYGIPPGAQFQALRDAAALDGRSNRQRARPRDTLSFANTWFPLGPTPLQESPGFFVSGRATVIATNPENPLETWLGTATGGLWHTTNAQGVDDQWLPLNGLQFPDFLSGPNVTDAMAMSIGAIAVDGCTATGCQAIWIGTGEDAARRDTYYGAGLFLQTSPAPIDPLKQIADFRYGSVVAIALAPHNKTGIPPESTTAYVAVAGGVTSPGTEETKNAPEPTAGYGVHKTIDGGMSFTKMPLLPLAVEDRSYPTDIQFDPSDPSDQTLLVAVTAHDRFDTMAPRGIFRTTTGGAMWCSVNDNTMIDPNIKQCAGGSGLPPGNSVVTNPQLTGPDEVFGWTTLRFSHSVPGRVYALVGQCGHRTDFACTPSLYRSDNGGLSWGPLPVQTVSGGSIQTYGRYTHALTVVPGGTSTTEQVVVGGVELYQCSGEGAGCGPLPGGFFSSSNHLDHHAVVFPDAAHPGVLYDADDGGFFWNANAFDPMLSFWIPGNGTLSTSQFDSVAVIDQNVFGGLQDNGMAFFNGTRVWRGAVGGDGGQVVAFLSGPQAVWIYSIQREYGLFRSVGDPTTDGNQTMLSLPASAVTQLTSGQAAFFPPLAINRTTHDLYFATTQIYKSSNNGDSWAPISPVLATPQGMLEPDIETDNVITALGVGDDGTVYAGTYVGEVWQSFSPCPDPSCWVKLAGPGTSASVPHLPVSSVVVQPGQSAIAYVALSGFLTPSHVWTWNLFLGGWQPLSDGLVDAPADVIRFDASGNLWLGTDIGIYELVGTTWMRSQTLPFMPVLDIASWQDPSGAQRLDAATHGRGIWVLTQPTVTTLEGWTMGSIRDVPVYGYGFDNTTASPIGCIVSLIQKSGHVCARDTMDVNPWSPALLGGEVQAEPNELSLGPIQLPLSGQLDTTQLLPQAGTWQGKPVVWACNQGTCMRLCDASGANCGPQVPIAQCNQDAMGNPDPLSTVEVDCGAAGTGFAQIQGAPTLGVPPSGSLTFSDPPSRPGPPPPPSPQATWSFEVVVSLTTATGAQLLCRSPVSVPQGSTTLQLVTAAAAALNVDPGCRTAGVTAVANPGIQPPPNIEDPVTPIPALSLRASGVTGSQLLVTFRAAPGSASGLCFDVSGLGNPLLRQAAVMKTAVQTGPAGAAGGSVRFQEVSDVGSCSRDVVTSPGMTASQVAAAIGQAFGTVTAPGTADCLARDDPLDIQVSGSALLTAIPRQLRVCSFDPGIGFAVAPNPLGVPNLPPSCSGVTASPDQLWPPDHRLTPVALSGATDPDGDPVTLTVTEVRQDENPEGETDALLQNGTLLLRAQRDGNGDGRVYHVSFTLTDPQGASCSGQVTVCVPHDQGKLACVDEGALYPSGVP